MILARPYTPTDLDALYAISLATGDRGGDASHLYGDPKLIGHIYSAPYGVLRPDLALVVEDCDGVAGYAVGAVDTRAWEALLEESWWPTLRPIYPEIAPTPDREATLDGRRIAMIHRPECAPRSVVARFPAHLHMNLLPRCQGQGIGRSLFEAWMALAAASGGHAIHIATNRANIRAVGFWSNLGFADVTPAEAPSGRTVWMGRG